VNTDELEEAVYSAERKVRGMQTKLHRWAREDSDRRFDDLFVRHEALLTVWR
jgi:RNA-directed DNA polymerase